MKHLSYLLLFLGHFAFGQSGILIDWALPLSSDYQPIGKPNDDYFHFRKNGKVYRMNAAGNISETPYDSISYSSGPFWAVWKNGLAGIWDQRSGQLIPPVYEGIKEVSGKESCWAFIVRKYGMAAVVDAHNRLLLPWIGWPYRDVEEVSDSILIYKTPKETWYLSKSGRQIPPAEMAGLKGPEFRQLDSETFSFSFPANGKMETLTFQGAEPFTHGLAAVRKGALWGYIRENGQWQIQPQFQEARPFNAQGHAIVKTGGKYGLIRRDGSFVLLPGFVFLKAYQPNLYEVRDGELISLVDTTGLTVLPPGLYSSFATAGKNAVGGRSHTGTVSLYTLAGVRIPLDSLHGFKGDADGEVFMASVARPSSGKQPTIIYGLANSKGEWVLPPVFLSEFIIHRHFILGFRKFAPGAQSPPYPADPQVKGNLMLYNRQGEPSVNQYFTNLPRPGNMPVCVFQMEKRSGLASPRSTLLPMSYDEIQVFPDSHWVFARSGVEWGVLRWETAD